MLSLALDPRNPRTLYAGTDVGLFQSVDGSRSWRPNYRRRGSDFSALAIDPRNPTTIYAGTDYPGGAFKSTDGGRNWRAAGLKGEPVQSFALDLSKPGTVYVASDLHVFKSTNAGASWRTTSLNGPFLIQTLRSIRENRESYTQARRTATTREASSRPPMAAGAGDLSTLASQTATLRHSRSTQAVASSTPAHKAAPSTSGSADWFISQALLRDQRPMISSWSIGGNGLIPWGSK